MRGMKRSFAHEPLFSLLLALPFTLGLGCSDGGSTTSSTSGGGGEGGDGGSGGPTTTSSSSTGSSSGGGGMGGMGGNGGSGGAGGCTPGQTAACYTGPFGTEGLGVCKAGVLTCLPDGSGFGACEGEVVPTPESCTTMGDDDCDGMVNEEGCACIPGSMAPCYTGPMNTQNVGPCKPGIQVCNMDGSAFGPCIGEVVPAVEMCATPEDDDCDGQINEAGPDCVCIPNTMTTCYSGPTGTAGVGICKAGMKACNAQGTAYGPCIGEVLPMQEDCMTPADENCLGAAADPCGTTTWLKAFGDNTDQDGYAVATDAQGNVVVVGQFVGTIDFGGGPFSTPNTQPDIFVAKLSPTGSHIWSRRFGANGADVGRGVAIDAAGDVILTGVYQSTVDFGGGPMVSVSGTTDAVVVKLAGATGAYIWAKGFGSLGGDEGSAVAVDSLGNIAVVGHFRNTVDFGGGGLVGAGLDDIFLVKLSSAGAHLLSKAWGDPSTQNMRSVAFDSAGSIYFTGYFEGTVDFGGGAVAANGTSDAMLVKLSSAGAYLWSKTFGAVGSQVGNAVAVDTTGNVVVTGNSTGSIDFGGGALPAGGANDVFLAKYDTTGAHLWSKLAGDSTEQLGLGLACDKQNNVIVTGRNAGTLNLGGSPLVTAGLNDIFIAKLDPTGAHLWSKRGGDALEQYGRGVATDPTHNIFLTGRFQGTLDLGTGPVTSPGGNDIFLAKLLP